MYRVFALMLAAASLVGVAPKADAQTARQARQQVEASMVITGHVDIERNGGVSAYALDEPEKVPAYVTQLIENFVPSMRFEPLLDAGESELARAKMSLRLIARPADDGTMNVRIASAYFKDDLPEDDARRVRTGSMAPPRYPPEIARMGGTGVVYLLIKVGRDGTAEDVVAEQVNLTALGTVRQMESIRTTLAKTAVATAKSWTFVPPTEGDEAARDYWVVRMPVSYYLDGRNEPAYGRWASYHPGPRQQPDWAAPTRPDFSPDVVTGITPEASRFKLLTAI